MFAIQKKNKLKLIGNAKMLEVDAKAIASGIDGKSLMENAGKAVVKAILQRFSKCKVIVLCGPGNNGGDGFVIARLLAEDSWDVSVILLGQRESLKGDATIMERRYNGKILPMSSKIPEGSQLVVDAIFGAGLTRDIVGIPKNLLTAIKYSGIDVVAVDIPSGIDGDTGEVSGISVYAKLTVTFSAKKPGHILLPGKKYCGEVLVVDICHPKIIIDEVENDGWENAPDLWLEKFPQPKKFEHKYTRGHVVVVGGNRNMTGAARLAAISALRVGAGVVTISCNRESLDIYAQTLMAVMVNLSENLDDFKAFISNKNVVLIGPGAGICNSTKEKVLATLEIGKACVIDADALTVFQDNPEELFSAIHKTRACVVLTPHMGEFQRLFGKISIDKVSAVKNAVRKSGAIILLKGADTIIADLDNNIVINTNAPATLATAGSGDVLAGFIAGLLAGKMPAFEAASAAAWLHGECASLFGFGLISEDLPKVLPNVLANLLTYS